ncbi:hypothetical protein [Hoeflea sp. AS16]|uniref:hypothetical protein n=1 Tax=Hoeflea sp. AS16 TaxID=3135779 RepID=UPI0031810CF2
MKMFHLFDAPLPFLPLLNHTLSPVCVLTTMKQSGIAVRVWGLPKSLLARPMEIMPALLQFLAIEIVAVPEVCSESACGNSGNGDGGDNKIESCSGHYVPVFCGPYQSGPAENGAVELPLDGRKYPPRQDQEA